VSFRTLSVFFGRSQHARIVLLSVPVSFVDFVDSCLAGIAEEGRLALGLGSLLRLPRHTRLRSRSSLLLSRLDVLLQEVASALLVALQVCLGRELLRANHALRNLGVPG